MAKTFKPPVFKCPWCSKSPVPISKGRVGSHVTPGNVKCMGIGQPLSVLKGWHKANEEARG